MGLLFSPWCDSSGTRMRTVGRRHLACSCTLFLLQSKGAASPQEPALRTQCATLATTRRVPAPLHHGEKWDMLVVFSQRILRTPKRTHLLPEMRSSASVFPLAHPVLL